MQSLEPIPAEEVRTAIDDLLDQGEFRNEPSMLEEFVDWLGDLFSEADVSPDLVETTLWIIVAVVGAVLLLLVTQLIISTLGAGHGESGAGRVGPGPSSRERGTLLRRQARAAREAGDRRRALRLSLFALGVGRGARGNLLYRDAWTNRELLRRGEPGRETRLLLSPLVDELEAKDFGREPTTDADLDRLESLCDEHLGRLREVAT